MIWIVTANSNLCRIYHLEKHPKKLTLLKEINHPENRLKRSEYFTSDKPGHYKNDGAAGGAYVPHSDPKEVAIDHLSREIANELNNGRNANAYDKLMMITDAHMTGLISKHINKHILDLISHEIQKDVMQLSPHELLEFIQNNQQ